MKIVLTGLASLALSPSLMAQSAEPTPAAEFIKRANLWQVLQAGGPAMIPLGILSVITLMLVIAFLFSMRRGSVVTKRFMQTADALIRKRDFLGLLAVSNRHNESIARVVQRMMNFLTKNPKATMAEIREIAQTEGMRQASALNQQVAYLADIGTIAPMVGLLGTVIGIVRSFGVIAIDAAATRPTMLAQGIGEALIATAAGLLIGIPAMAAYSFFRGRAHCSNFRLGSCQHPTPRSPEHHWREEPANQRPGRERGSLMNFRAHVYPERIVFQIAPMVDILLFLLVFFILTWNFSRNEAELDVKVPAAQAGKENRRPAGEVILNVKKDGGIVMNRRPMSSEELLETLSRIAKLYPDQAVILRGDENVDYRFVVDVLDVCRAANIWNVAFATSKPE